MSAKGEKKALRKTLSDRKLLLSVEGVKESSEKILNTLSIFVDWVNIKNVHIYLPIEKNNEVDTKEFINFLKQKYPIINIQIAPQQTGADTPVGNNYDVVVIPLLGFDRRGHRLGYGGGYYDKFLAKNRCERIIGLAYSFSEVEKITDEPHDQKMHTIITEKEIIRVS